MPTFQVIKTDKDCDARLGILETYHGKVQTPAFMPVGTSGTVKGIMSEQLEETGAEIMLANTYHLMLRPGVEVIEQIGGLHKFMAWNKPILTDSGGYQIFSLSTLGKVDDDGVEFSSHVDGTRVYLNAESAIEIQNRLGADIIMCFDECAPFPATAQQLKKVVERTIAWAKRSKDAHANPNQLLFGITQGGIDKELRRMCTEKIIDIDFDGYAIGGLSVGEGHDNMVETVNYSAPLLPKNKPRYLMGVGMPADIVAAVRAGIDMFDCVLPTRNGRNAFAFTNNGPLRLRNNAHIASKEPIEHDCDCYCCQNFTRSAVRHFFNIGEMLGPILLSLHNLRFFQRLTSQIRAKLANGEFNDWADTQIAKFKASYSGA